MKPADLQLWIHKGKQGARAMNFEIPLDRMSTADKLRALEIIREDLQHPG